MTRDELARHLYIHALDSESTSGWGDAVQFARQTLRGVQWDDRQAPRDDVEVAYSGADRMIANGEVLA